MARRILFIAGLLAVLAFLYFGYTRYDTGRAGANGDVYSNDPPANRIRATAKTIRPATPPDDNSIKSRGDAEIPQPAVLPNTIDPTRQPGTKASSETAPLTDTINPNPPNGMVFSGTGHFQLYRQGDLTWRLNTNTGQSCVLFATDNEWKKPRVLRAGCNQR